MPSAAPNGRLIRQAIVKASKLTFRDRNKISNKSLSRLEISLTASFMGSKKIYNSPKYKS